MTFFQSLRLIILPQAFRSVVAPLGSVMIAMTKNTTIAIAAGYLAESAFVMKDTFDATGVSIPIFLGLVVAFMAVTLPIGFVASWLVRRLAAAR
jgi:glutamate transport system permease protein